MALRTTATQRLVGSAVLLLASMAPSLAAGTISGKVTVPAGASLEMVRVDATNEKFVNARSDVAADGSFSLSDLAPGTYTLVAIGRGLETVIIPDLVVKDGQELKQPPIALAEAKPFPIVYAKAPIPLTDDYNSTSFADAPVINVNQGYQIRSGPLDDWRGPAEVGGKFRLKASDEGLHMAADLNFKIAGINNRTQADWDGNSIEFFFQNDKLDLNRVEYHDDHNWQFMIALTEPVHWQRHQPSTGVQDIQSFAVTNILRKERPNKDGELVRINIPWTLLPKTATSGKPPVTPNKVGDLAAMDIVLNSANYDVAKADAGIRAGLSWSGYGPNWNNPSVLRPIQFVEKAP